MKRIVVVGSSNTDLIGYCEQYPKPGETILGITGTYTGENSNGVGHSGGEN